MKTEHTQGPWRIDGKTRFGDFTIAAGESVKTCQFIAKTQSEANARLIAAAPELLKALKELCADKYLADPINSDRMKNARVAISKVGGNA